MGMFEIPEGPKVGFKNPVEFEDPKEQVEKELKKHPEQREDEIFLGMFEGTTEDGEFFEGQEQDDRTRFEDIRYETKRKGAVEKDGTYSVFVSRDEYEKTNKE